MQNIYIIKFGRLVEFCRIKSLHESETLGFEKCSNFVYIHSGSRNHKLLDVSSIDGLLSLFFEFEGNLVFDHGLDRLRR